MEKELRCPKCSSSQTRNRIKTGDRICYVCGHSWKITKEDDSDGTS